MKKLSESDVEESCLGWLADLGWQVAHGSRMAPDADYAERAYYDQVILERRLQEALARLNQNLPVSALTGAFHKLTRPEGATAEARNRAFHLMLVNGVNV